MSICLKGKDQIAIIKDTIHTEVSSYAHVLNYMEYSSKLLVYEINDQTST